MFAAIAVLFVLPWLDRSPVRSMPSSGRCQQVVLLGAGRRQRVLLGWCGANAPDDVWLGLEFVVWSRLWRLHLLLPALPGDHPVSGAVRAAETTAGEYRRARTGWRVTGAAAVRCRQADGEGLMRILRLRPGGGCRRSGRALPRPRCPGRRRRDLTTRARSGRSAASSARSIHASAAQRGATRSTRTCAPAATAMNG